MEAPLSYYELQAALDECVHRGTLIVLYDATETARYMHPDGVSHPPTCGGRLRVAPNEMLSCERCAWMQGAQGAQGAQA